jgi:hypothetical protein
MRRTIGTAAFAAALVTCRSTSPAPISAPLGAAESDAGIVVAFEMEDAASREDDIEKIATVLRDVCPIA